MRCILWSALLLLSSAVYAQQITRQTSAVFLHKLPAEVPLTFTYKTFERADHTFGYEVFANNVLLLRQEDMPCKPAGTGFTTLSSAARTAERILLKLQRPIVPPIVTADELNRLNIH